MSASWAPWGLWSTPCLVISSIGGQAHNARLPPGCRMQHTRTPILCQDGSKHLSAPLGLDRTEPVRSNAEAASVSESPASGWQVVRANTTYLTPRYDGRVRTSKESSRKMSARGAWRGLKLGLTLLSALMLPLAILPVRAQEGPPVDSPTAAGPRAPVSSDERLSQGSSGAIGYSVDSDASDHL
jgi:hypothetical protein